MSQWLSFVRRMGRQFWSLPAHSPTIRRTMAMLKRSQRWDQARMTAWQLGELNRLLHRAKKFTDGYGDRLRHIPDAGLADIAEIDTLPFLTKQDLQNSAEAYLCSDLPRDALRAITSGGTTGAPTRFMVDARDYDSLFDLWRETMWQRADYRKGARYLDLTWAFDLETPLRRGAHPGQQYLSIHALTPEALKKVLPSIRAQQPEFIVGFPSTVAAFARLLPAPETLQEVRGVILASETLTATQGAVIAEMFPEVRIFSWYGMAEMAGFASGCEHTNAFHHWPQSGILELVDERGEVIREPGRTGEIVLTGFSNQATLFIRYKTGDRARLAPGCPHCRRPGVVLDALEGRVGEYLLGRTGRRVTISALNFHSDEFRRVITHQYVQQVPGHVTLVVVAAPGFSLRDQDAIMRLIGERLGDDFNLEFSSVSSIPRTPRGKQPLIIRHCADEPRNTNE